MTISATLLSFATRISLFLLPSFIYPWRVKIHKKLHPTSYLDGLRGVAALLVVIHHYACQFTPALLDGWGSQYNNYWFLQLPVIRIVHSGPFMVEIFYVLSGFVLSRRGLQLARQGKQAAFTSSLASSVFRRWLRLSLPVMAAMFIAMLISRAQLWHDLPENWLTPWNVTNVTADNMALHARMLPEITVLLRRSHTNATVWNATALNITERFVWTNATVMAPRYANLTDQLWDYLNSTESVVNPFGFGAWPEGSQPYNPGEVLWTIPMEWLGSMVTFITVLGLAWTKTVVRIVTILVLVAWCHYETKCDVAQFLSGVLLAEITLIVDSRAEANSGRDYQRLPTGVEEEKTDAPSDSVQTSKTVFWSFLFFVGIFLGSKPLFKTKKSWGWRFLWYYVHPKYHVYGRLYTSLGSVLIVLSLNHCATLQRIFTTRTAQYLGRISFSLYLLHVHLLWTMGTRVIPFFIYLLGGGERQVPFTIAMFLGATIMFPLTLWAADIFTRGVDENAVAFARWIADKLLTFQE